MTAEELNEIASTKITARCDVCGHNWKIEGGGAMACPFCYNAPEEATLVGSLLVLGDDGDPLGRSIA